MKTMLGKENARKLQRNLTGRPEMFPLYRKEVNE